MIMLLYDMKTPAYLLIFENVQYFHFWMFSSLGFIVQSIGAKNNMWIVHLVIKAPKLEQKIVTMYRVQG